MSDPTGRLPLGRCKVCDKPATKVDGVCDEHWEEIRRYLAERYATLAQD